MKRSVVIAGALLIGVLAVVFLVGQPATVSTSIPEPALPPAVGTPVVPAVIAAPAAPIPVVEVAPVAEKKSNTVRVLIAAEGESVLAAQMAGRIVSINAKLGERVSQGQTVLRFDCDEQQARLNMARAEGDGAQKVYEAKSKLQAMQSASLLEVSQAAAEAEKFKAQIQLVQAQLRLCNINAPFAGRVTKLRIKPHESVVVGQALVEVINDEHLKVQVNIPSLWLARLKINSSFTVRIDETGKTYEARVRRINGKVDAVSQSVEIEGELLGRPADLLPGMSGIATFPDVVPDAA